MVATSAEMDPTTPPITGNAVNINKESLDCGITALNCCNGPGCQKLATQKSFLIIFAIVAILQGAAETYFRISAKQAAIDHGYDPIILDWLLVSSGIFQGLLAIVVTYWAHRIHRIAWLGGLVISQAVMCFLVIIPSIFHHSSDNEISYDIPNLCGPSSTAKFTHERQDTITTLVLLFVCQLGMALGQVAFYALGLSYIDDNAENVDSPAIIGTAIGAKFWGSHLGAGISLGANAVPLDWWLGWTIISPLLLVFGILIAMFPKKLLNMVIKQAANRILEDSSNRLGGPKDLLHDINFFPSIRRLITNKVFMFNILAVVFIQTAAVNYVFTEEAYLQSRFFLPTDESNGLLDEWTSRLLSYLLKPLMVGVCVLVVGLVIARINPSAKSLIIWNISMGILAVLLFVSFIFINCDSSVLAGAHRGKLLKPSCSRACVCPANIQFSPVCPENGVQTFFSPCHAGCRKESKLNELTIYEDCDCGVDIELTIAGGRATQGACNYNKCQSMWILHQTLTVFGAILIASTLVGKVLITLRSVLPQDKALALSFELFLLGILVYIPGRLGYEGVSNHTCQYRTMDNSKCYLQESPIHGNILNTISASLVAIGVFFDLLVFIFAKDLKCFIDDEEEETYRAIPLQTYTTNNNNNGRNYEQLNNTGDETDGNLTVHSLPSPRPASPMIRSIQNTQDNYGSSGHGSAAGSSSPARSTPSIIYAEVVHDFKTRVDMLDFRMQKPVEGEPTQKTTEANGESSSNQATDQSTSEESEPLHPKTRNDRLNTPETDF